MGWITLDRPEAINALDLGMIRAIATALDDWQDDSEVQRVVIDGAGDRGLCAGGDVRALAAAAASDGIEVADTFFREEYRLNARIAEYPLPVIAIADGITMGGGIGLAGHAAVRIVTERSRLAMPETRIGFTPDVGGSALLARAPGRLGEYLGLTGSSMGAADAVYAGFADYLVPSDRLPSLYEALETRADPGTVAELVMLFDETPDPAPLAARREWIDEAFSAPDVASVLDRLAQHDDDAARETARALGELAPTSLAVTLESVRRARTEPGLRRALAREHTVGMWLVERPDFAEGIRAQLVDKDRSPRWRPPSLADVSPGDVAAAFSHPVRALWD